MKPLLGYSVVVLLPLHALALLPVVPVHAPPPERWTGPPPQMPGLTLWRQRNSGSGCRLGSAGRICLPPQPKVPTGDCRGVQSFHSGAAPVVARFWRWTITASHDDAGPTIHYLQLGRRVPNATHPDYQWLCNSSGWVVNASAETNGPAANLVDYSGGHAFWNSDQPPGCPAPWVATIDTGTGSGVAVDSLRYSIFDAAEAPLAFVLEAANTTTAATWQTVISVANASASNCQNSAGPPQSLATDSFGLADFFLALAIGVPRPHPSLLVFTEARKFSDEDWGASSHCRDCHFADALSPSLLMHLPKVQGGAAE